MGAFLITPGRAAPASPETMAQSVGGATTVEQAGMSAASQQPGVVNAPGAACLTGGSGGPSGELLGQSFSDSRGRQSQYHIFAEGLPAGKPVGLLLQFHGDGGSDFKNPEWAVKGMAAEAAKHNIMTISMLTPDSNTMTWWRDGESNAMWVRELIQKVAFTGYNIDRSRIWLAGYSGGAGFVTQYLVPAHSDLICGGGSIVFGGGGEPNSEGKPFAPSFVQNFKMHWYTGREDTAANSDEGYDALSDANSGFTRYQELGFSATKENPPGVGHTDIPFAQVVGERLALNASTSGVPASAGPTGSSTNSQYARPESPANNADSGQIADAWRADSGA